jgi:sugar lactone lactonase YvrE
MSLSSSRGLPLIDWSCAALDDSLRALYSKARRGDRSPMRLIKAEIISTLAICAVFSCDASAHPGWGILRDRQGQIFFSDVQTNTVWRLNREHRLEAILAHKHSHSLFEDEQGNLFGEHVYYDNANARWISSIWKLTRDGQLTDVVPPTDSPPRGSGIFLDRAGNVYSVQGGSSESEKVELLKRSPAGQITVIAGGQRGHADGNGGQARFNYVIGMVWGPDGSLYATDAACARKITMDGTVTTIGDNPLAGVARSEHPRLLGIAVDSSENVYVADYDYGCVRRIARDGAVKTLLNSGFYWSPSGVTAVGDDLYVLEHQPESGVAVLAALNIGPYIRVRKLSADGTVTTIATVWGRNTALASAVTVGGLALAIAGWRLRKRRRAHRARVTSES